MFDTEESTSTPSGQPQAGRLVPPFDEFAPGARKTCFRILVATLGVWPCLGSAVDFETGNKDLKVRWDNTLKYSAAFRLHNPSAKLTSAAVDSNNVNQDDGDLNFKRGLISNRVDLLSEFDLSYKDMGLRMSGAGWYDTVYNRHNDNPGFAGGATPNQVSVPYNEFTRATRKVHGRGGELLDAFVFGNTAVGDDGAVSFRLGRHALVWGETLFFGTNGIAGGMMPVDAVKLVSVPNTQFKEAIRPVPMLSGQWQITPKTSVGAYYQFRWAKSRLPAVGSYFSASDITPDGGEQLLVAGPGSPFLNNAPRLDDQRPKNSGQGGFQFRTEAADFDLGAYLIRYHAKTPMPVVNLGPAAIAYIPTCPIPTSFPTGPTSCALAGPVSYRLVYQEDITSFGFSSSKTVGSVNLASEVSFRSNQPLTSGRTVDTSALSHSAASDNDRNPAYPVARTAHANVSAIWTIDSNPLFREGAMTTEVGWNRVLKVQRHPELVDPASTRDAIAVRTLVQATYRQVMSGLDLGPQIGLGWAPHGSRSAITPTGVPQNGTGDVTLGVDFTYLDVWQASLAATHYFGGSAGVLAQASDGKTSVAYKNFYGDRDFVAFSLRRSF